MLRIRTLNVVAVASFLLLSFATAYGTYLYCATDIFQQTTSNHGEDHHSSHSGGGSHSHESEESSNEDCCDDLADSFFKDAKRLVKPSQVKFSTTSSPQLVPKFTSEVAVIWDSIIFTKYIDPPPRSVHIHIINQSFRI